MNKKIVERIIAAMHVLRVYVIGEAPAPRRAHYFAMNPAGKMVRKSVTYYPRKQGKKRR
ncbi:MAG: hypothetical protein AB7H77_00940 [Bdellovibrionales bacterium]